MDKKFSARLFCKKRNRLHPFCQGFLALQNAGRSFEHGLGQRLSPNDQFAEIRIKTPDQKIIAAVTHLDHLGVEARFQQAKIIGAWVKEQEKPVVLMGDFNEGPRSRIHTVLTSPETPLCDT
ncbi:MAG: hypothetical protein R2875_15585 [Desulfobacterales bacterium]